MEDAAKAYAAANPGVEIIFGQGTSATDIEGQIALIESMVTQGVQGIALTPVDPTVAPALDKAIAAGVKVVLMDNNIPDWEGRTALATTDNYAAGKIAGEYLTTVLKDGDTLGILEGVPGRAGARRPRQRHARGPRRASRSRSSAAARPTAPRSWASTSPQDLLTANPDLKAIYAACGPPAAGAAQGDQERRHRTRRTSSSSASTSAAARRRRSTAGIEDATVAQFPTKMAELGVDALVKAIRGEKVEILIDSGAALVTKDNMVEF